MAGFDNIPFRSSLFSRGMGEIRPCPITARRAVRTLLLLIALAVPLHAQSDRARIFSRADRDIQRGLPGLTSSARDIALDVDVAAFRHIASSRIQLEQVPLSAGRSVDLDLEQFDILLPGTIPTVTTQNGAERLPASTVRLYKGTVAGEPGSHVFLAIGERLVLGSIFSDGVDYEISSDPAARALSGILPAFVYPFADVEMERASCGVTGSEIERMMNDIEKQAVGESSPASFDIDPGHAAGFSDDVFSDDVVSYAVKGAYETDLEFLASFDGDVAAAHDFLIATIGRVSATFESEASCQIVVNHLNIWASDECPYSEPDDIYRAVEQVQDLWSWKPLPERGFLMVLSGKPWGSPVGVVTQVNRLCNLGSAYGYALAQPLNPSRTYITIAHETGHLFGAHHTHNCAQWKGELDHCFFPEQGNCFNVVKDTIGTLMSYCSVRIPSFGDVVGNFLKNITASRFASGASCVIASRSLQAPAASIGFAPTAVGAGIDTLLAGFFTNNGRGDITITGYSFSGSDSDKFLVIEPAFPLTLSSGESRDLTLRYRATAAGSHRSLLTIAHNAYSPAMKVVVEAMAVVKLPILDFEMISASRFLDFGTPKVGDEADTAFRFINRGSAPLAITDLDIVGRDRAEFTLLSGSGSLEIAPAASAQATIRLAGTTPGLKQAWLRIESNSFGGRVDSIRLTAVVLKGGLLEMRGDGSGIDFGEVMKGATRDTSIARFFANVGSDTLHLSTSIAGPDRLAFTITDTTLTIAPGSSAALDLIFHADPQKPAGARSASLLARVDARNRVDSVALTALVFGTTGASMESSGTTGHLVVVPNPATGSATVLIYPAADEQGKHYSARIAGIDGREVLVRTGRLGTTVEMIELKKGDLAPGIYFIRVTTERGVRSQGLTILP